MRKIILTTLCLCLVQQVCLGSKVDLTKEITDSKADIKQFQLATLQKFIDEFYPTIPDKNKELILLAKNGQRDKNKVNIEFQYIFSYQIIHQDTNKKNPYERLLNSFTEEEKICILDQTIEALIMASKGSVFEYIDEYYFNYNLSFLTSIPLMYPNYINNGNFPWFHNKILFRTWQGFNYTHPSIAIKQRKYNHFLVNMLGLLRDYKKANAKKLLLDLEMILSTYYLIQLETPVSLKETVPSKNNSGLAKYQVIIANMNLENFNLEKLKDRMTSFDADIKWLKISDNPYPKLGEIPDLLETICYFNYEEWLKHKVFKGFVSGSKKAGIKRIDNSEYFKKRTQQYSEFLKEAYAPIKAEKEAALLAIRKKEEAEKAAAANAKKLGVVKGMSAQTVARCQSAFDKAEPQIQVELIEPLNQLTQFNQSFQSVEVFTADYQTELKNLTAQFDRKLRELTTPKVEVVENPSQTSNAFVEGVNYKSAIQKQHDLLDAQKSAQIPSVKHRKEQQDAYKTQQAYKEAKEARIREAMHLDEEVLDAVEKLTLQTIQSFRGKDAKDVFYAAQDFDVNLQNTLKNLNTSKSLQEFRQNLSPGANFKTLENIKVTWNNEECPLMSLRMNQKNRIYFFWSKNQNKALRVFYGDLHNKENTLKR